MDVPDEFWDSVLPKDEQLPAPRAWEIGEEGPGCAFTRSIGDSCMKDVECARFYNERVPDGLAKMLPLPKKPYVSDVLHANPPPSPSHWHPHQVSNKAEVRMRRVAKGDQFVIIACDGLWDEMSSCQAPVDR